MNLYLANGFHGHKSKTLFSNVKSIKEIFTDIDNWKDLKETRNSFRVEPYNSFTLYDDCIVVDFGDYSTFLEIGEMTEKDITEFKTNFNNV